MLNKIAGAFSAQMVTRVLIVSYFVAIALGLISGIEISLMAESVLPPFAAMYLMRFIVLVLSGMVLFGIYRRPAALVLALIVFFTSYLTLFTNGGEIGAFWRDLALIGGLLLTANVTTYADRALSHGDEDAFEDEEETAANGLDPSIIEPNFREDFDVAKAS